MHVRVRVWAYVPHMSAGVHEGQKGTSDSQKLDLQLQDVTLCQNQLQE